MKQIVFSFFLFFIASQLIAQNKDEQSIKNILEQQTKEWNNGNLEKFIIGYWESDSVVFMGKTGPVYGYQNTLKNYKKGYPDTAAMGKLRFELISIKKLSNEYYFVIGKYFLTRSIGNASGAYTLLFRKIKGEWKIVVDHSS